MSIIQSQFFKGNARETVSQPHRKGETLTFMFSHTFSEDLAATDILDLFPLPPYCKVVGLEFLTENVGAAALDIGLMSGDPGSLDATRTSGVEFIDGVAADSTTENAAGLDVLIPAPRNGETRTSIGVKTATAIAADPGKVLHVKIEISS